CARYAPYGTNYYVPAVRFDVW
nr:immunoglobulin heavy chain junction region [Macaca mulatta]MOW90833.1 immunoglobulin heavy chain junction region [Macaca mulatta]